MLLGNRILVVVPARGGSKGIPRKNIALVAGKPLIQHTTELLKEMRWIDKAVVSTDDKEIADKALIDSTVSIVWRPKALSGDRIGDMPVLAHALAEAESNESELFDVVVMLQPTSPLRTAAHVLECTEKLVQGKWDAVWTVSETDLTYHPEKQIKLLPDASAEFFIESGSRILARQSLSPAFHRNGVAYAFSASYVRGGAQSVFSSRRTTVSIVSGSQVSIDNTLDLLEVERALAGKPDAEPGGTHNQPEG